MYWSRIAPDTAKAMRDQTAADLAKSLPHFDSLFLWFSMEQILACSYILIKVFYSKVVIKLMYFLFKLKIEITLNYNK